MTVFCLRGGNGSGKTTVHRWLIENHKSTPMFDVPFFGGSEKKANAWELSGNLHIIGKFQGGADAMLFESLRMGVEGFSQIGHVFFENILVSGSKQAWLTTRRKMSNQEWCWMTLNTPAEICLERIYERNGGKPIKEDTIIGFNKRVQQLGGWLKEQGEDSIEIEWTNSIRQVHDEMEKRGWHCGASHEW